MKPKGLEIGAPAGPGPIGPKICTSSHFTYNFNKLRRSKQLGIVAGTEVVVPQKVSVAGAASPTRLWFRGGVKPLL